MFGFYVILSYKVELCWAQMNTDVIVYKQKHLFLKSDGPDQVGFS